MKTIYYISYIRWPGEKAHASYVTSHLHELSERGYQCTLVVPKRVGVLAVDPGEYYGKTINFSIQRLWNLDLLWLPIVKALWHRLGVFTFAVSVLFSLPKNAKTDSILFTNDLFVAWLLARRQYQVVYEVHDYPGDTNALFTRALQSVFKILCNNQLKVDHILKTHDVPTDKIFALHNGVSVEQFATEVTKASAREKLGLAKDARIAVYTGHLYGWKGAQVLAEAAKHMTDIQVLFVGGTQEDIAAMQGAYKDQLNITICGHKPPAEVPLYLKAADVLVLPNSGTSELSVSHTSPMKVFEYMATDRPIVASNLPAIREIVNEEMAVLVEPDSPEVLATAITTLVTDEVRGARLAAQALQAVQRHGWEARADALMTKLGV